ncbi:MAG TPA: hypothetical protein PKC30_14100 [Saprospiraceae bacterium]|nr:hypothetical protein [Saprospiraceae bacterium]
MTGDKIILQPYHIPPAQEIFQWIQSRSTGGKKVVTIAGESGSGKSTLAIALKKVFTDQSISAYIFHMDDYFHLPPSSNHQQRLEDINHVGPQEVNLSLLQQHVNLYLAGEDYLEKPLVHYKENEIRTELASLNSIRFLIVEGTYTSLLDKILCKVFMTRNYKETWEDRMKRARDPISPFIEEVLEIEHQIIKKHKDLADIYVDSDYKVHFTEIN